MNVLVIGAHFDDAELGCGGTIARHVRSGDNTILYVHTHSGYTDFRNKDDIIRMPEMAIQEGKNAAKMLGAELIYGNYDTLTVEFNDELICTIKEVIEDNKIDLIYTHWPYDVHQDHSAIGRATITAGRHIPNILLYRSNWYDTVESFNGNFYVDISDYIEIKKAAVREHKSELKRVGEKWLEFFLNQNRNSGQKIGVEYSEIYEVVKYLY